MRIEDIHGIVEHNAGAWYGDLGAKRLMDGLRHGHHIALGISDRQMGGVPGGTAVRPGIPGLEVAGALEVDLSPACRSVELGGQATDRYLHEGGIPKIFEAVGKGDLQGLGEQMD